ncbi:hypothetical protein O181_069515 [Austropuccinia psidii MF-1]|uniref:Reverse transcriptase domain-containing protein n=1 Tax=Austropuccinia psidii MF-1 TaxID=1389203 RepID=A0A9Q3EUM8_9BASI|nr:hypothetical protein [Austropuccinia psidii MF-1]
MDLPPSSYNDSLEELWDEEEEPEEIETIMKVAPSTYHQYLDVFSKVKAEKLPPYHACDHNIELEGSLPPVGVIYSSSKQESDTLRAYSSENLEKGFIRPSSSSTGAPVLFVKKKESGLCLCVDYQNLNAVTRKNKYPVPPMNQLLNVFNGSSIFSKIDLRGAYNLLRIKEGKEHLICFRAKYGSYEYLVMPFGLTNAPASFQNLVNNIFQDILDVYVVVYLDDIMVFSKSEEEHVTHVSTVLSRLSANNLFAKVLKPQDGPRKRRADSQFATSKKPQGSSIIPWLCQLLPPFHQELFKEDQSTHQFPQKRFLFPPQLGSSQSVSTTQRGFHHRSNPSLPTIVETNASNYALGAVLGQVSASGKPPIAFGSRKPVPAELNYEIHDKELLGIVWALKRWRAFLLSLYSPFEVLTNHSFLQSFMSSKFLTRRQAHWAEFLSEFHFSITYHPGCLATLLDALSRWDKVYPQTGEDSIRNNPMNFQQLIKQDELQPSRYFAQSLFFTFYGRDPKFDSVNITKDTPSGKLSTKIQSVQQGVKTVLEVAINRFKRYADESRASPPDFNPGDMVWLSSKNIKSTRPTKKLSERWLGPFPILKKVITHAYHLKLPSQWKKINPVFHISLLEPVKTATIPNRHQEPPPPIIIEEGEEWEVSQILDSKLKGIKLWYLVEWKGFSQDSESPHGNQLKTSRILLNLSKIFIVCILTSQDLILQKLEFCWCLVGREITKSMSHSWYAPLGVFYSFLL